MEENRDALNIFFQVRYQLIMSMDGPVSILHSAIHSAIELYEIVGRRKCFEKVSRLSDWWIERVRDKDSE